jgi:hypothetical protein
LRALGDERLGSPVGIGLGLPGVAQVACLALAKDLERALLAT